MTSRAFTVIINPNNHRANFSFQGQMKSKSTYKRWRNEGLISGWPKGDISAPVRAKYTFTTHFQTFTDFRDAFSWAPG